MFNFIVRTTLLLAAVCSPTYAGDMITCQGRMQRLSCDHGVISLLAAAYGRTDGQTCSQEQPAGRLANTACSLPGALELVANRCDGRKFCEFDKMIFDDPCPDTYKYIQTTHTCLQANHVVACEESVAELSCDSGQVISIIGAFYGRNDRTTCIFNRPASKTDTVTCFSPAATQIVAKRCNGGTRCSVSAVNSQFGDPCPGINKYMELGYACDYALIPISEDALIPISEDALIPTLF